MTAPDATGYQRDSVRRLIDSLDDPADALRYYQADIRDAHARLQAAVDHLRLFHGWPWAKVGAALGITRQAAWERFHR